MWHAHAAGPACRHDGLDASSHNSCSPWLPAVSSCCECEGTTIGRTVEDERFMPRWRGTNAPLRNPNGGDLLGTKAERSATAFHAVRFCDAGRTVSTVRDGVDMRDHARLHTTPVRGGGRARWLYSVQANKVTTNGGIRGKCASIGLCTSGRRLQRKA